jgi:hypothetical protein
LEDQIAHIHHKPDFHRYRSLRKDETIGITATSAGGMGNGNLSLMDKIGITSESQNDARYVPLNLMPSSD